MQITFVKRHLLFYVNYLRNSENKLENAPFFKEMKEAVADYNPDAFVTVDISPEMFIKTIGLTTTSQHGYAAKIVGASMKGLGSPAGYIPIEQQLGSMIMNLEHPDHDAAGIVAAKLGEIRANFDASVEADAIQTTLSWLNGLEF